MAERPGTVALLGGGVIGGGWAARFLLNGVDVRVYDPAPDAERRTREMLENARRAYRRLTLTPLPVEGRLSMVDSVQEAVRGAALVQESVPERIELKTALLGEASRAADPGALICSSTSGLRPTLLAAGLTGAERFLVAHPFNPVYLLPLVELCGGERTAPDAVERAGQMYRAVGMRPLVLRHEIDGFIADRLLEALWREALWLVHDELATVQEVDDAIRFGAGLRWAIMGTFLTYRIAGGEAGMRHFMEQFGPALKAPWSKLKEVPELTDVFLDKLAQQSDDQARGLSVGELERTRDDCLVAILQGLRANEVGAGRVLAAWERSLLDADPAESGGGSDGHPAELLELVVGEVPPDWIDYNGHVHESRYLQAFGDATDALLRRLGVDEAYLTRGHSYYTVETHLSHLGQLGAGDRFVVRTQILGWDERRVHLFHSLLRFGDAEPVATAEQMLVHVDTAAGRAAAVQDPVGANLAALAGAHAALSVPGRAGRRIALQR